jgi:glycosyltransferase involved in cell wall biosynthesis
MYLTYTRLASKNGSHMPMNQRPKVLLLIPHLGGGGAERVTALLAEGLSSQKYELHLGLITQADAGPERLATQVTVHALGAKRVRTGAVRLLRLVRRLKPDLILSGMAHLNFLVLLLRPFFPSGTRVLVRQNGTVSAALTFGGLPGYTRMLYRLLYRHADRVICQTAAMAKDIAAEIGIPEMRLAVLPNPVDVDGIRDALGENSDLWTGPGPHLLAVGRLSREKGFDLLLRALVSVRERFPGADLVIAGTGPEEAALKDECRDLGLETTVRFAGYVEHPSAYFSGAPVFVLSSRHEGLPNAMLEAAAGGLPIVALPASQGMVELLRGQPGTWLAAESSSAALAASLLAALEVLRPGERFAHTFIDEYRIDRAVHAYEDLIDAVLKRRQA